RLVFPLFVPAAEMPAALALLPYACVSFWLAAVAGAVQSGLEGCSRYDLRNVVLIVGQVLYVGLALWWVRRSGLVGVALAQVVQGGVLVVSFWLLLRRELPAVRWLPGRWDRALFREMLGYGLNFQAMGLLRMIYEPTTKALMSAYGGLALTGYYEMAGQLVTKLRALLVAAQQVMTPEVAALSESAPERVREVYAAADAVNWYLCVPVFALMIAAGPLASYLWIGHVEPAFVVFTTLLALGWFANAITGPAFFLLLGTGEMRVVVASHVTIAVVNGAGGWLLGTTVGGYGVAGAWAAALTAGAVHLMLGIPRDRGIPFRVPPESRPTAVAALGGLGAAAVIFLAAPTAPVAALAAPLVLAALLLVPMWRAPHRARLLNAVRRMRPA
ncbi:MAG TPA: oligosaccharide flippase family protein, partial [Rhodothermales bacterium]|nr:oligosaccharide flippase family protein [Rhodothermales bacterium]